MAEEQPSRVPPNFPVPSYNSPGHLEADFVDQVDLTAAPYSRLAQGTLYSAVQGANKKIADANTLFLLHETMGLGTWPYSIRFWGNTYVETQGQDYDQLWDVVVPYVDTFAAQGDQIGDNRKDIQTIDRQLSKVRTFDPTVLNTVFGSYLNYFADSANLRLPEVLTALTGIRSTASGTGTYSETATGTSSGTTFFLSMHESGEAQGSGSELLDVLIEYTQYWGQDIDILSYYFFLQSPVTATQILTKIQSLTGLTISAKPKYVTKGHSIVCVGQKKSGEGRVKKGFQYSNSSDGASGSTTHGTGKKFDVSCSRHSIRIPPMIHGALSVGGTTSSSQTLSATASITDPFTGTDTSPTIADTVTASLSPTSFSATSVTSIPASGLAILHANVKPYRFGWALVAVDVIDWANLQ